MTLAHDGSSTRATRSRATSAHAVRGPAQARPADEEREAALSRVVAEIDASLDIDQVVRDALGASRSLFRADVAALWLVTPDRHPLRLAGHVDLAPEVIEAMSAVTRDDSLTCLRAIAEGRSIVLDGPTSVPDLAELHARLGFRTIIFVPLMVRDKVLALLALYHHTPYAWTESELEVSAAFAGQMAIAVANAQLFESVREGAARLRAIQELSARLNRIQEIEGIGEAIVAEADKLIRHDTIRVYRVDQSTGMCEPVAFHGEFVGIGTPSFADLRVRVGDGLTGWTALHNSTIRLGDASADGRGRRLGGSRGPESMLLVPMSYESRVLGVIVLSKAGYDQYSEDDQRILEIFAGYAAQALVNAEAFGQVRRQQQELHHRLESQRRLLEVNERLLATLDQSGVLEMIADSLKTVVSYDSLTIYRVDRSTRVRRAVVARDEFAELILSHETSMDTGITGWAIRTGEAVLANDANLDPRSIQIPGTPEEPESMIVCPLLVGGEVIGTLNVARMGGDESHFTQDEFELVQLFAAQASIALRNADAHGAIVTQAEHDALTGLRNHGAFQRELGELLGQGVELALLMLDLDQFKGYNDTHGHPAGDELLGRIASAMQASVRDGDRVYRYGGDEFAILLEGADAAGARVVAERIRSAVARLTETFGPAVSVSVGIAHHPEDAQDKDGLVAAADRALYLAKPADHSRPSDGDPTRDLYLAAVDETTLRLMERLEPRELVGEIMERAAGLVGVRHAFLYLLESPEGPGGEPELVERIGTGVFEGYEGYRLPPATGVGWAVVRSGRPVVVDDYATYPDRARDLPAAAFGAVCAVPLTSGGEVLGVIGLASGDPARTFSAREVEALARFGKLASVALDNARLFERVQSEVERQAHAALHDHLTGLPNRVLLVERLAERFEQASREKGQRREAASRVALVILDLDRFTVVNEGLGHAAGDLLLAQVGRRLLAATRTTDLVARLGSDEFGILLGPVRSSDEVGRLTARIEAAMAEAFDLDGIKVAVDVSLGIAIGSAALSHPLDLLKQAEVALHRAKADPGHTAIVFDPEMHAQTLDRATMEHDLRGAIERSELRVHYQPLVELRTGGIVGVEALLRWEHPSRGLVPPLAFIPLAEETGLILPIGRWVLETACQQLRAWRRRYPSAAGLAMSVNLSARQFTEPGLIEDVAAVLKRAGLEAGALEVEITESVVMDQSEASVERLQGLRSLGVKLVLDDFGTGYSSLGYLRRLPLDTIKVDQSFVAGLGSDSVDFPIVDAVISLAHGLGIDVVAEGIETTEQLEILRDLACDRGQGYLFSRPLPASTIETHFADAHDGRPVLNTRRGPADR